MKKSTKKTTRKKKWYRPEWYTPIYQNLIKVVRKRDGMKCQFPGCKRRRYGMQVHHILPFNKYVAQRYNPFNCILLCSKCHEKVTGKEHVYAALFSRIVMTNTIKQNKYE